MVDIGGQPSQVAAPVAAAAAAAAVAGQRTNRRNYTIDELTSLFEVVEELLPISGAEWEQVEHRHHSRYPERHALVINTRRSSMTWQRGVFLQETRPCHKKFVKQSASEV